MRHPSRFLSIAIVLLFISSSSFSQAVLSAIVKKGEIRIGMTGKQPPYSMKAKSGELIGYEVDLANALAKNMGVKLTLVELPFAELMGALKAGKVDAVMSGMTITPDRNMNALFAGPYTLSGKTLLTKSAKVKEFNTNVNTPSEKKYKIVALKGSTSEQFAKTVMSKHELVLVDKYDDGVAMILTDKVDALVADRPICVITLLKNQGKDLVMTEEPLTIEPIGMALPPGDAQFLNLVENYLTSLELSGTLPLLEQKWFNDGAWMLNVE